MTFPSLDAAIARAGATARRFPLPILAGVIAFAAAWDMAGNGRTEGLIIATALMGIALLTAARLLTQWRPPGSKAWSPGVSIGVQVLAVALLVWCYLAARSWMDPHTVARYLQLALVFHLLLALIPMACRTSLQGFWQFNRVLFLRFLLGVLYTGVLFAGLAIAVASIDALFGVDVAEEFYLRLWFFLAFVFNTWFVLAGVPEDLEVLEERSDYPNGLKLFAQFALIPIVTVYLLILTAYLVKVLFTWSWPSGWIGWLVSSVAVVGTLVLLLVHPLREREDSAWINVYGRWFYVVLIPSAGMLLVAIGQRIGQYGLTEPRYFLLVLAVYLAGIALYYAVTASRDIRIIPTGLLVLAVVTFAGPWSAYSMSERSQAARLDGLLAAAPSEDRSREASAALRYLISHHGVEAAGELADEVSFPITLDTGEDISPEPPLDFWEVDRIANAMLGPRGIDYSGRYFPSGPGTPPFDGSAFVQIDRNAALPVGGFEWMANFGLASDLAQSVGEMTLRTSFNEDAQEFVLDFSPGGSVVVSLAEAAQRFGSTDRRPAAERPLPDLTFEAGNEQMRVRMIFREATIRAQGEDWRIESGNGVLLIGTR